MSRSSLYATLLLVVASSCATFDEERNLAPLYSEHWTADGGIEEEAFGGSVLTHRPMSGPPKEEGGFEKAEHDMWAIRPLFIHEKTDNGSRTEFLAPFGTVSHTDKENTWALLPLARYSRLKEKETHPDSKVYSLIILPLGIFVAHREDGWSHRAAFPFAGNLNGFLTFDELSFRLFPLYMRSKRLGRGERDAFGVRTTYHWLFPVFSYSSYPKREEEVVNAWRAWPFIEEDEVVRAWRVWPLVGHDTWEERYDRWFFLWPIFQYQRNDQRLGPEKEELTWAVFPFFGRTEQGTFRSTTVLWPFFGYSENPANGFRSLDLPWPLVSIQEPGTSGRARRFRIWPIYSRYEGDGMVSRSWAWPFIHHRVETYPDGERTAISVLPFYQSLVRRYEGEDEPTQWQKLWPLWQHEEGPDHVKSAIPALNPLWRGTNIDRHYGWLWELYSINAEGSQSRQRGWLGLWRQEANEHEIRTSLGGLWGRRTYRSNGALTHENSLLFGLIRWRSTEGEDTELLSPKMPGPGWPLAPSTELLEPMSGPAPSLPEPLG